MSPAALSLSANEVTRRKAVLSFCEDRRFAAVFFPQFFAQSRKALPPPALERRAFTPGRTLLVGSRRRYVEVESAPFHDPPLSTSANVSVGSAVALVSALSHPDAASDAASFDPTPRRFALPSSGVL